MVYFVIGGQHVYHCYGCRESLHAAKVLATKSAKRPDVADVPSIYRQDQIVYPGTVWQAYPRQNCLPIAEKVNGHWRDPHKSAL